MFLEFIPAARTLTYDGCTLHSLLADSQDEDALAKMVKQTKVVITTAGPYHLYGSTLVKVCAENGVSTCRTKPLLFCRLTQALFRRKVHCLDLTGEPLWSHKMQGLYSDSAKRTKALFIHGCGFDSIPGE